MSSAAPVPASTASTVSAMPAALVQRACTACSVLLDVMVKRLLQERDKLTAMAATHEGAHHQLHTHLTRLEETSFLREHISVHREGRPPPKAPNNSGLPVHVSLLAVLLRILGTWSLSTGPKITRWILEAKQLLPLLLEHTTAVELCRDQIPMLLFRGGAFDLLPTALARAETADQDILESLRAVNPAAPPKRYLDFMYSRIAWSLTTYEGHFSDQRGWLFLIQDGVINPKRRFQLAMELVPPASAANCNRRIASGSSTTLQDVLYLYHSPATWSLEEIQKINQQVSSAPRNIVEQLPAAPPSSSVDVMLWITKTRIYKDFLNAMEIASQKSKESSVTVDSKAQSTTDSASLTSANQENVVGKHILSIKEELESLAEYCRVGFHRLAVDQTMDVLFSEASDILAVFNNYAHVLLNITSATASGSACSTASSTSVPTSSISERDAARFALPFLLFIVALQPYGHSDDRISRMIGKAWARLTITLQRLDEAKTASYCWQMATSYDCGPLIPSTTADAIMKKLGHKRIMAGAGDHGGRFDQLMETVLKHARLQTTQWDSISSTAQSDSLSVNPDEFLPAAAKHKESGNKHVLQGHWLEASEEYSRALQLLAPCARLATRIAQCCTHHMAMRLNFGKDRDEMEVKIAMHHAITWAMAALLLQPHDLEAHATYTRAVMEFGSLVNARETLEAFKTEIINASTLPSDQLKRWQTEANELQARLQSGQLRSLRSDQERPFTEKDLELLAQHAITTQSVAEQKETRIEREARARQRHEASPVDKRVTPLHQEFVRYSQLTGWPLGLSRHHVSLLLEYAAERARLIAADDVAMPDPDDSDDDDPDKVEQAHRLFIHRLTALIPELLMWWSTAKLGDHTFPIEYIGNMVHAPYTQNVAHAFSNFVSWPTRVQSGQIHVAVGFVDLGQLRTLQLVPMNPVTDGNPSDVHAKSDVATSSGPPAQWIGFELVEINVAKCAVLLHMLQQDPRDTDGTDQSHAGSATTDLLVDDCMLVWYSATWSPRTLRRFRSAVEQILTSASMDDDLNPGVRAVLEHWNVASRTPLPLRAARTSFQHDMQWHEWLPNIALESDRMAVCSYGLTRDLLPPSEDWVASVTWFQLPPKWHTAPRESVFNVVPLADLLRLRDPALGGTAKDVVQACAAYLREGIHHARNLLCSGRLVARVECGRVELKNETSSCIKNLRPTSISWSNLVDYQRPKDFHALLREVSAGRRVTHMISSMNYTRGIKGAYYVDYMTRAKREKMLEQCQEKWRSLARTQTPFFRQLLTMPPIDNRWNMCCWPLALHFYRKWMEAFFAPDRSGVDDLLPQVRLIHPPYYYFMGRNNVTISMEYEYPV